LLKIGADGLGDLAYGALGMGSLPKPGSNGKSGTGFVADQGQSGFSVAHRIYGQLKDPRMGQLAGKPTTADLKKIANSPNALRVIDSRSGHINVI
jgi:hypothetical protein